jgi:dethiobiotin synthase
MTLLTDFGYQDTYVGQMRGVISAINPAALVIDLTHAIAPQQILQAAIALDDAVDAFPPGTIHVAIVDPGVGSQRRAIAAEVGPYRFVCPDNGLLTPILQRYPLHRAVQLDEPRWWRSDVSNTFHGRDLFAPVAAAWSLGRDLSEFGSPLGTLQKLTLPGYEVQSGPGSSAGFALGQVLTVDHFGNLITNLPQTAIPLESGLIEVEIGGKRILGLVGCYADRLPGECVALFGSSGRLEIAIVNGDARSELQLQQGEPVTVRWSGLSRQTSSGPSSANPVARSARGLFIAGTDTNVGKTEIAALIIRSLRASGQCVGAYKPVCSGAVTSSSGQLVWEDIERLRAALGDDIPNEKICPQRFQAALAPPLAAQAEGRTVDFGRLVSEIAWWRDRVEIVIVEGAGGLLSPVSDAETGAELAMGIGFPLIVVARCGLGTINHTLLTIEAARQRGLQVAGVVLNQSSPGDDLTLAEANALEIERRGDVSVLGILDWGSADLHRHGRPVTIAWSQFAGD